MGHKIETLQHENILKLPESALREATMKKLSLMPCARGSNVEVGTSSGEDNTTKTTPQWNSFSYATDK